MKIKRTAFGFTSIRADADEDWSGRCAGHEVYESDLPTHSPVLGPDGQPLEYEPRATIGFKVQR